MSIQRRTAPPTARRSPSRGLPPHFVRSSLAALLVAWAAGSTAAGQQWAKKMFEATSHDFGTVARNAKTEFRFALKNIYVEDVHVASARVSCGCISTRIEQPHLKTYQKGAIVAKLNTKAYRGQRSVTITVVIDRPFYARVALHVKGYIRSDVTVEPGQVSLGAIDRGTPIERTIAVTRRGYGDWRILEVKSTSPHVSGEVVDVARLRDRTNCRLRVRVDGTVPAGAVDERLVLVTNDRRSSGIPIVVEGRVVTDVRVSPESLFLGVVRPKQEVTRQLVVRGTRPFRITAVTSDGSHFDFKAPNSEVPKPIHVIPVTFIAGEASGKVTEIIRIQTDLEGAAPQLSAFAVVRP
ncbi:MAG: DUF1573 domain-containing protein [Planctomycetota bacterium]|jgi:hypothetical protein